METDTGSRRIQPTRLERESECPVEEAQRQGGMGREKEAVKGC